MIMAKTCPTIKWEAMMNRNACLRLLSILTILLILAACATLPEGFERPESFAYSDTDNTRLGRAFYDETTAHPGQSGFLQLASGLDAFVARAVLAQHAERSIDAQYYLYHDDLTGRLFTSQLVKAADRGVRVRLLVDDMDLAGRDLGAAALDSHPNMEVRILTNSLASTDVGIVHAGYAKYRKALLRAGVELYETNHKLSKEERKEKKGATGSSKASLHAKSFVFDRNEVFIGSLNLDPRAIVHNTEIGVVFTSAAFAKEMGDWFDQNIDRVAFRLELQKNDDGSEKLLWHGLVDGKPQVFDVEPYTGFWRRLGIAFMSLWPIESQL